jgi:hypothetical protein
VRSKNGFCFGNLGTISVLAVPRPFLTMSCFLIRSFVNLNAAPMELNNYLAGALKGHSSKICDSIHFAQSALCQNPDSHEALNNFQ